MDLAHRVYRNRIEIAQRIEAVIDGADMNIIDI